MALAWLTSAMQFTSRWLVTALSVCVPAHTHAQSLNPSSSPQTQIAADLEAMTRDQWQPAEHKSEWLAKQRAIIEELDQRPDSALAALIRRAAARVDVEAAPIVVRRGEQLTIALDAQPMLVLDTRIRYVADVYASLDGGEWFQLGRVREGAGCGARNNIVASNLTGGIHRMHLVADISFLRESARTSDTRLCEVLTSHAQLSDQVPAPAAEDVIQRELRALPAVSFGIFSDLLGAPLVAARALEAGLPETSVTQWLDSLIVGEPDARPISNDDWMADFCRPEESWVFMGTGFGGWRRVELSARQRPRDLCVNLLAALPDDRVLSLRLRVGTVHEDAALWSFEAPAVHDLSLGGSGNVMDISSLELLPQVIMLPAGALPELDVSVDDRDIRYEPADAATGAPITITARLRNSGGRDAPFITGFIAVQATTPPTPAVVRDFLTEIPVDSSVDVSFRTTMPASGTVVVQIAPFPATRVFRQGPHSQLRDVDIEDNTAEKPIGLRRVPSSGP